MYTSSMTVIDFVGLVLNWMVWIFSLFFIAGECPYYFVAWYCAEWGGGFSVVNTVVTLMSIVLWVSIFYLEWLGYSKFENWFLSKF